MDGRMICVLLPIFLFAGSLSSESGTEFTPEIIPTSTRHGEQAVGKEIRSQHSITTVNRSVNQVTNIRRKRFFITLSAVLLGTAIATGVGSLTVSLLSCKVLKPSIAHAENNFDYTLNKYRRLVTRYKSLRSDAHEKYNNVTAIAKQADDIHYILRNINKDVLDILDRLEKLVNMTADNTALLSEEAAENVNKLRIKMQLTPGAIVRIVVPAAVKAMFTIYQIHQSLRIPKKIPTFSTISGYKTSWRKIAGKVIGKLASVVGIGMDINSIVSKAKTCDKIYNAFIKHKEEVEGYVSDINKKMNLLRKSIKSYEDRYKKYINTLHQTKFVDFLKNVTSEFKKAVYIPSFSEESSIGKIQALSRKLSVNIADWSSNEDKIKSWIKVLEAYKKDTGCLSAQLASIATMVRICKDGGKSTIPELYDTTLLSTNQCDEQSRWEEDKVIRQVKYIVAASGSSEDCPFNNPLMKEAICDKWFMGISPEDIAKDNGISKQKVKAILRACKKKTLTAEKKKLICYFKYIIPFQYVLTAIGKQFSRADIKTVYDNC